jgi:hypothetical protein
MIIEVKYLAIRGVPMNCVNIEVCEFNDGIFHIIKDNVQYVIDSIRNDLRGTDNFNRYFTYDTESELFEDLLNEMDPKFSNPIRKFLRKKSLEKIIL